MTRWNAWSAVLFALAMASAGCLGMADDEPGPGEQETEEAEDDPDLWEGKERIRILDAWFSGRELDLMCQLGGAPPLTREAGSFVLPGTDHLQVRVEVDPTFTGMQLGYVLDDDPAPDEARQEGISWLPVVRGEERVFEIEVGEDEYEDPEGPQLWTFFHRMQPMDERTDCYTGGGIGDWSAEVDAVAPSE